MAGTEGVARLRPRRFGPLGPYKPTTGPAPVAEGVHRPGLLALGVVEVGHGHSKPWPT